jgi:two-component system cell cycle sensor histidine kinase/response regulator CckA
VTRAGADTSALVGTCLLDERGRILACDPGFAAWFDPPALQGELLRRWIPELPEKLGHEASSCPCGDAVLRWTAVDPAARPVTHQLVLLSASTLDAEALARELKIARQTLRSLVDAAPIAIVTTDLHLHVTMWNRSAARTFGWSEAELLGRLYPLVPSAGQAEFEGLLAKVHSGEGFTGVEVERQSRTGEMIPVRLHTAPLRDAEGVVIGGLAMLEDLSKTRALERQKMEAIGRLAGGVAHDFNNLLTVILAATELLATCVGLDELGREQVDEIRRASESARRITAQLLTFGRREVVQPRIVDIHEAIRTSVPLLRRLVGDGIVVTLDLAAGSANVRIDAAQFEQILLNLSINARDAMMPKGGTLRIGSRRRPASEEPTDWLELEIADDGTGIPPEVLPHVFEPFYTTKATGHGSGLGLATVFGIVRASGGSIGVESGVGEGARFWILLPLCAAPATRPISGPTHSSLPRGTERLLVVDDEPSVRRSTARLLSSLGYSLETAASGDEALAQFQNTKFDLLLTDLSMPQMTGTQLAARIREFDPALPIVFMSGNVESDPLRVEIAAGEAVFLQKPITLTVLATCIRQMLDGASGSLRT